MSLIAVTVLLIAATYFMRPVNESPGWNNVFKKGGKDPFEGRFKRMTFDTNHPTVDRGAMTRCHNCGSFFPESRVIRREVQGHILEFCSESCKRNFLQPGLS